MQFNEDKIRKYRKNKPHITLTIATHDKGVDEIFSFGNGGASAEPETRAYEIGSISKIVLSTLLAKCLEEGVLSLDDTIDRYIELPPGPKYPSIRQLATQHIRFREPRPIRLSFGIAFLWILNKQTTIQSLRPIRCLMAR